MTAAGAPGPGASLPTVGDLVTVAEVETVVRLDEPGGLLGELVLTGDVASALGDVLATASGPRGAGFFVVGPFGSGKSHFLAAAAELMGGAAEVPGGWAPALREAARTARHSLAVRVPLVDYRAEAALEDVVGARAWRALRSEAPAGGADRLASWDTLLGAAKDAGHEGLVLLLDEASEWLRAKRGPALTEDLRFLQFLGEWSQERPVLALVALQENIDEVANVSEREMARIRDRYHGPAPVYAPRGGPRAGSPGAPEARCRALGRRGWEKGGRFVPRRARRPPAAGQLLPPPSRGLRSARGPEVPFVAKPGRCRLRLPPGTGRLGAAVRRPRHPRPHIRPLQ